MTLLIAKNLISCANNTVRLEKDMGILMEDGLITKVAPRESFLSIIESGSAQVIDAGEGYVLPGLIDSHVHLTFSSSVQPVDELLGDDDSTLLLRAAKAANMELRAGVTTVRDCGARGMSILKWRDFINAGQIQGCEIISCGMPITITGGHCNFCGLECDSMDDVVKAVRWLCKNGVDFIKVMISGGNMTPGSNPMIDQYDYEMLAAIVKEAHQRRKKVSGHVHSTVGVTNAVKAGVDNLDHCSFKTADGAEYLPDVARMMVEKGLSVSPAMGKAFILPPELAAPQPDKVAMWGAFQQSRFSITEALYRDGVLVTVSTDAGCKNVKFDEFYLTMDMMEKKVHMSKEDVLLCSTARSAENLGIGSRVGQIREGMQADIAVFASNPMESFLNLKSPLMVFKKGERVRL